VSNRKIETGGFPQKLKQGTGLAVQKDLSHKVSAKQTDTMFQTVSRDPTAIRTLLPKLKIATDLSDASKPTKRKFETQSNYLQNHAPYTNAPMSPKSSRATYDVFNAYANKNPNNLRPRPDSENRSIGQFPHFNFDQSGNISPRGKHVLDVVYTFDKSYRKQLRKAERQETDAYTQLEAASKRNKKVKFSTEDQVGYAQQVRNKK